LVRSSYHAAEAFMAARLREGGATGSAGLGRASVGAPAAVRFSAEVENRVPFSPSGQLIGAERLLRR
jgi:hypothetical protein